MRDRYLMIISALIHAPNKPLKFYLEVSKMSRGTFFKAKAELVAQGVISTGDAGQIVLDRDKGLRLLADAYPGVSIDLDPPPHEAEGPDPTALAQGEEI